MIRWITGALYGLFFWLVIDFLFYAGIYVHYMKAQAIPVFFNAFFIAHQVWWLWPAGVAVLGALFMWENRLIKGFLLLMLVGVSALTWVPTLGERAGYTLFSKAPARYRFGEREVSGVRLYSANGVDFVRLEKSPLLMRYPVGNRVR